MAVEAGVEAAQQLESSFRANDIESLAGVAPNHPALLFDPEDCKRWREHVHFRRLRRRAHMYRDPSSLPKPVVSRFAVAALLLLHCHAAAVIF